MDKSLEHIKDYYILTRFPYKTVSAMKKCIEEKRATTPCDSNFKNRSNLIRHAVGKFLTEDGYNE